MRVSKNLNSYISDLMQKAGFVDDRDTKWSYKREFYESIAVLNIESSCPVCVLPVLDEQSFISVEIDTDSNDRFDVFVDISGQDKTLVVKEKISNAIQTFGSQTVITNNFGRNSVINGQVFKGQNVVISNGNVWIDGKLQEELNANSYPYKIKVMVSHGINLELDIKGVNSFFVSSCMFDDATINASGMVDIAMISKNLDLSLSGQTKANCLIDKGDLEVDVSGQSEVKVEGEYLSVNASLSGMGRIQTEGICSGNYKADVSGMGSIVHIGQVFGKIKKSISGMGSINIQD